MGLGPGRCRMDKPAFKVTRRWLSGPLKGARSVLYTESTYSVGYEGRSPQGRYVIEAVEPATVTSKEGGER